MMPKKFIPSIFALFLFLLFTQCEKEELIIDDNQAEALVTDATHPGSLKGPPDGKGGGNGGHTETAGNNLSFPAFLLDGYSVTDVAEDQFTVIYTGDYSGLTAEDIIWLEANGPWYPQKTEGNLWQADYEIASSININHIDWGDAIEAVDPKLRRPYRLELVLYVTGVDMEAFTMAELEYPSSKDELQGTNAVTYRSSVASVASPYGEIVVQRIEGIDPATLEWNGTSWQVPESPDVIPVIPIQFQVENNVGGKLIFGASVKGWKPTQLGAHRITFYVSSGNVILSGADISNYNGDGSFDPGGERNWPEVDDINNLTFVDVVVAEGGGGGGGH